MGARIAKAIWKNNKAGVLYTIKTWYKAMLIKVGRMSAKTDKQQRNRIKNSEADLHMHVSKLPLQYSSKKDSFINNCFEVNMMPIWGGD